MGSFKVYKCNNCDIQIELGGPQEYRKNIFRIKDIKHPPPPKAKIHGLRLFLWCPQCLKMEKKIMVEFVRASDPIKVWGRTAPIKTKYRQEFEGQYNCTKCDTYLLDHIEENTRCIKCNKGTIDLLHTITT